VLHGKYLYEKFKDILNIYSSTEEIIGHKYARDIISTGFSNNATLVFVTHSVIEASSNAK